MSFIKNNLDNILKETIEIADTTLGGFPEEAITDIGTFLEQNISDLDHWFDLYQSQKITEDSLYWLLKSKKDLMALTTLTKSGLSLAKLEKFRLQFIDALKNIALNCMTALLKSIIN